MRSNQIWMWILGLLALTIPGRAHAQGCIVVHNAQPLVSGLNPTELPNKLHGLTVTIGYRTYNSFRHFSGETEEVQREVLHTEVRNHVNQFDVNINYQLTPRWSLIADVPAMEATRNQIYAPKGIYRIGGLSDVTVGAQGWVWRPPTEDGGNVAVSAALKLPTGTNDATGTGRLADGTVQKVTADQSIQPGDGTWGFVLSTQAYKRTYFHTVGYFTGSWTFNPQDTTGVRTYRPIAHEQVMSAPDQYLWRGGFSRVVPKVHSLAASFGGRMEGVPVRDAFGASNGFRRPGYVISIEPGIVYQYRRNVLMVSGPWAVERNRKISTSDLQNHTHGDAAFADYSVLVSYSHTF